LRIDLPPAWPPRISRNRKRALPVHDERNGARIGQTVQSGGDVTEYREALVLAPINELVQPVEIEFHDALGSDPGKAFRDRLHLMLI
jgi:hypothetical protein